MQSSWNETVNKLIIFVHGRCSHSSLLITLFCYYYYFFYTTLQIAVFKSHELLKTNLVGEHFCMSSNVIKLYF